MIKIYGIKNCDSVKKAQRFLLSNHIDFEFIDFRQKPIDSETLLSFVDQLGWDGLINKRSTTYRNLSDEQKNNITSDLVLKNPTLIKRPVLVTDQKISVGFSEKLFAELI